MNAGDKRRLKIHFENKWFLYLLSLIFALLMCGGAFYFVSQPKKNEKINIFVMARVQSAEIGSRLSEEMKEYGIKSVDVKYGEAGTMAYDMLAATYMPGNTDILILDEKGLSDAKDYLAAVPERYSYLGEAYTDGERVLGVKIGASALKKWLLLDNADYFVAFNSRSEKVSGEEGVAYKAFERLLEICAESRGQE